MKIETFEYTLKNGKVITIRSPKEEDIQSMLEYLSITAYETEFILRYPEECVKYTYEKEKALFESVNKSACNAMIIALDNDKVIGCSSIDWNPHIKIRHRASIGLAIIKDYWNQGIATQLFNIMFEIAKKDPYLTQVELDVIEGNDRAKSLYEKLGFKEVATIPNAIRLKDGTLLSEIRMIKEIKKL